MNDYKLLKKRWLVLCGMFIGNICYGSMYVWSIFNQPLMKATGLPISGISLAYSLMLIVTFVFTLCSAPLLKKLGHKRVMVLSALFWTAGWFFTGFAKTAWQLYLFFSVLVGIGAGLGYNTIVSLVPLWFPDRKGLANGIAIGASGLAPVIVAPIAYSVLNRFGVFTSFRVLGILFALLLAVSIVFISTPPVNYELLFSDTKSGSVDVHTGISTKKMLQRPEFYLLWAALLCGATSGMMMTGHAANIGAELVGMTDATAALLVSLLAIMSFSGRLFMGMLSDKIGRFWVVFASLALIGGSMLVLGLIQELWQFLVAFSLVGFCFGAIMAVFPAVCSDTFGTKHMASNWSVLYSGYTAASFVGPFCAASFLEHSGSYRPAFIMAGCLGLGALLIYSLANRIAKQRAGRSAADNNAQQKEVNPFSTDLNKKGERK